MRYYLTHDQLMDLIWKARQLDSLSLMEKLQVIQAQKTDAKPEAVVKPADIKPLTKEKK